MATDISRASHRTRRLSRWVWAMLGMAVALCPVPGYTRETQPLPLDAIILMDDSGSMQKTDPLKLRFSALSLFIRLLRGDDAVGVVKFDEAANIVVPLQPTGTEKDRRTMDKASKSFSTRGAYTNLYTGLKGALQEIQRHGREQAEKAVILISDGLMDVNPSVMHNDEALRLLHDSLLPAFQNARVKVVTLALSPAADRALLEAIAAATGGAFFYTPQAQELSTALFGIFDGLKSPDMVAVQGHQVSIDASVKEATFFILTDPSQGDIALIRPDGVRVDGTRKDPTIRWFTGKDYVLSTVQGPLVGTWRVDTAGQRPAKVVVITDVRLEVGLDRESYVAGQEVRVSARLVGTGHPASVPLPLADLTFTAAVLPPDAPEGVKLFLSRDVHQIAEAARDPWYGATYPLPSSPGEYRGRVTAVAPTFSREKSFAFRVLPPPAMLAPLETPASPAPEPRAPMPAALRLVEGGETGGDAFRQDTAHASPIPSPWFDALRKLAVVHGVLLVLGGGALLGRRLTMGAWWTARTPHEPPTLEQEEAGATP
jgi:hypothetical protein